ncbi:MAG TPA: phenylalanine--tRNA ligase subunit beta [Candidatus Babeliales bacterium]|nr:phenylalanine--tRNA ligase subunit beta [Candidatus Babeliales bacterium]
MKISLAWILDHINAMPSDIDINILVERFNACTAEIEGVEKISIDKNKFSIVTLKEVNHDSVMAHSTEWNQEFRLTARTDAKINSYFMVYKQDNETTWARASHIGGEKNDLLPELLIEKQELNGKWKETIEWHDHILEMDNKTITNRPDMWGHRGFAREIAALMKLELKNIDSYITKKEIVYSATHIETSKKTPIKIENNKAPEICKRFTGLHIGSIAHYPSLPWMAVRLARAGIRAIDLLVDLTNYVMLDISQPMHVFDVQKLQDRRIVPRMALNGEKLDLLDGQTITLTQNDLVITDGLKPIALAGVMGGLHSAEGDTTKEIFVEAANFDNASIRLSAAHHKIRTESSARFEKGLDPEQTLIALQRFLYLLNKAKIAFDNVSDISCVGEILKPQTIDISLDFLEAKIGTTLDSKFVKQCLETIGFEVVETQDQKITVYRVTVPSFRAHHITIAEDIVEEVARFYGYSTIVPELPKQSTHLTDIHRLMQTRKIKQHMAYALDMMEIQYYALNDESYLQKIKWHPEHAIKMKNSISQNWQSLLTSLVPQLLKAVTENSSQHHELNFFVLGRTWYEEEHNPKTDMHYIVGSEGPFVIETKKIAGIMFDAKKPINFYEAKAKLNSLFELLHLSTTWIKAERESKQPWFNAEQTAHILYQDRHIGTVGIADQSFFSNIAQGHAWIFELDADFLQTYKAPETIFNAPSKYPRVWLDISLLVPLTCTAQELTQAIESTDDRIISTQLLDFFTKEEWGNKKSLTYRFIVQDKTKTLTKAEIDEISQAVTQNVTRLGAEIR